MRPYLYAREFGFEMAVLRPSWEWGRSRRGTIWHSLARPGKASRAAAGRSPEGVTTLERVATESAAGGQETGHRSPSGDGATHHYHEELRCCSASLCSRLWAAPSTTRLGCRAEATPSPSLSSSCSLPVR